MNEPRSCCAVMGGTSNVMVNGGIWRRKPTLKALPKQFAYGSALTKVGNRKTVVMQRTSQRLRICLSVQEEVMSVGST